MPFKTIHFLLLIVFLYSPYGVAQKILVTTWNIKKGKRHYKLEREMRNTLLGKSDFICFQEIKQERETAKKLAEMFGYHYYHPGSDAILSKHPILNQGRFQLRHDSSRNAKWIDALVGGKIVRVYSPHLSFKKNGGSFLIPRTRGTEMRSILDHAEDADGPVIIAGDLNTIGRWEFTQEGEPAIQYAYAAGFENALSDLGYYSSQLAGGFFPMGRIDWVLTRGLDVLSGVKGKYAGSDHRWMAAYLEL